MNKTIRIGGEKLKLSINEGLTIQAEHLNEWRKKLNAECFEDLKAEAVNQNIDLPRGATGFDVWRGSSLDQFIANWRRKENNDRKESD